MVPDEDATDYEVEDALNGILQVIAEDVQNGSTAKLDQFEITVETTASEEDVKRILKSTFTHFFEFVRFSSISS